MIRLHNNDADSYIHRGPLLLCLSLAATSRCMAVTWRCAADRRVDNCDDTPQLYAVDTIGPIVVKLTCAEVVGSSCRCVREKRGSRALAVKTAQAKSPVRTCPPMNALRTRKDSSRDAGRKWRRSSAIGYLCETRHRCHASRACVLRMRHCGTSMRHKSFPRASTRVQSGYGSTARARSTVRVLERTRGHKTAPSHTSRSRVRSCGDRASGGLRQRRLLSRPPIRLWHRRVAQIYRRRAERWTQLYTTRPAPPGGVSIARDLFERRYQY